MRPTRRRNAITCWQRKAATYAWLSKWLPGSAADSAALDALALPANVRGAAFTKRTAKLYVLWAKTEPTKRRRPRTS